MQNSKNEKKCWRYLKNRFEVQRSELSKYEIEKISGDYWIHTGNKLDYKYETKGIRFLRETGRGLKPTTYALQLIHENISKNIVEVDITELQNLLSREKMIGRKEYTEGYVAIEYEQQIIGCGYFKNNKVSSRIPKGRSKEFKDILNIR